MNRSRRSLHRLAAVLAAAAGALRGGRVAYGAFIDALAHEKIEFKVLMRNRCNRGGVKLLL